MALWGMMFQGTLQFLLCSLQFVWGRHFFCSCQMTILNLRICMKFAILALWKLKCALATVCGIAGKTSESKGFCLGFHTVFVCFGSTVVDNIIDGAIPILMFVFGCCLPGGLRTEASKTAVNWEAVSRLIALTTLFGALRRLFSPAWSHVLAFETLVKNA